MVRIRKSVYSLTDTAPEIEWYRKAIHELKKHPVDQPGSWEFIAACHGVPSNVPHPPAAAGLWDECQHGTWFFLPWHRAYLAGFEALIAQQIAKLGGPADWALPYWDYSDAADPRARQLPPAFRNKTLANGTVNDLWAPRATPGGGGIVTLSPSDVGLAAMQKPNFYTPAGSMVDAFGGGETGWVHFGAGAGALEFEPHNAVHRAISGYMGDPDLAALDPIFWLHHCNIDRLWEGWRGPLPVSPRDPKVSSWLSDVSFRVPTAGGTFAFTCADVRDTTRLLHGYTYDKLPVTGMIVAAATPPGGGGHVIAPHPAPTGPNFAAVIEGFQMPGGVPELVASQNSPTTLAAETVHIGLETPLQPLAKAHDFKATLGPRRHFLKVEAVKADGVARDYKVFVGKAGDARNPAFVGVLATFGVARASAPGKGHAGDGLSQVFDITGALHDLGIASDDLNQVRISFEPVESGEVEKAPPDFPHAERLSRGPAKLSLGGIKIFAE